MITNNIVIGSNVYNFALQTYGPWIENEIVSAFN